MTTTIAVLIALVSTTAFVTLWFLVVRREVRGKQKAVEAAKCQLTAARQQCVRTREGPETRQAQEILCRSQSVYRQAESLYDQTLRKPWNALPALLMGYCKTDKQEKK